MEATKILNIEKVLAPKLRFKEFKGGWRNKTMGELGSFMGGGTPTTGIEKYWIGDVPWISSSDLLEDDLHNINIHRYLNKQAISESATKVIPKNSVLLISRVGVGKLAINKTELCTSQDFSNFIPGECDSYFIGYFLLARKNLLINFAQGTSIKGFTTNDIKSLKVASPALPEQQKIASFLSTIDEKIQQLTRKKELLQQYKKGVMQHFFSGKLKFKDENGKAFPKWVEKKLGDVGEIVSGLTYSPADVNNTGVLVLRSSNVQGRRLSFEDNIYVKVEVGNYNPVKENDILICVRNGSRNLIGKNAIINKKTEGVAFGAFMTVYRSESNLFLFHYFDTDDYRDEVHKNLGATINSINGSDLKKFKIPFPCKQEQKKIANYLSNIDNKIEIVNKLITQTQNFKKGLLQQMFV